MTTNEIDPCETVGLDWLKQKLNLSRATVFRRIAARELPQPCSPPGKKLALRKAEVLRKLKEMERVA